MSKMISDYVANKVMQDWRSGARLEEALCAELNQVPFVDALRAVVGPADVDLVLTIAQSKPIKQASLALSMLRRHASNDGVRKFLRNAWDSADSFPQRFDLLWRLLDDADLDDAARHDIFEFAIGNLDQFLSEIPAFFDRKEDILVAYTARLEDASIPTSKKWVYLVSAAASDDEEGVAALLREHLTGGDELSRRAAERMLVRVG
jgi:hypothetical protein